MSGKEVSPHDAAVLNGMLASSKIAAESLKTLKAEDFDGYDARLLFRLIGDMQDQKPGAREQTWRVLQRMKWTLPGDTEGTFSAAISRAKAFKDRERDIRNTARGMAYIGVLFSNAEELLAEMISRLAKFGEPRLVETQNTHETVSVEAQAIAAKAIQGNQKETPPQRQTPSAT